MSQRTIVIGAGPAGLAAAHELANLGREAIVYEQDSQVGGIARTVAYKGYRFDLGGHRFFTKVAAIHALWEEMLAGDFLVRPRLSRIYYRDHFFDYPLRPLNALRGLGPIETVRILASYFKARLFPAPEERTFEQWVTNRFGRRLFQIFFETYTEKVWGIPCAEIGADWASQRIQNLDLKVAVRNALLKGRGADGEDGVVTTLIDRFHYPRLGPGMMWEKWSERLGERGVETVLTAEVEGLELRDGRVAAALVRRDGSLERVPGSHFVSSMPVRTLIGALDPAPPADILSAAERLRYRDFLTVVLIVDAAALFPDNWIYIHSPEVKVGRIQNFKNWSPEMVPDPAHTSLGLEYFVQEGDELWSSSDEELVALGIRETTRLGLLREELVLDGTVFRLRKAYPVYDAHYGEAMDTIRGFLSGIPNLYSVGRNGQHRYNNQDHSMLTGIYAARNIAGARHDLWSVNVDAEYHESTAASSGDRLTPSRASEPSIDDLLRTTFARYDPLALGAAIGFVAGFGLFALTALGLLTEPEGTHMPLSLVGQYLLGYTVTWGGALIGLAAAGAGGFAFGCILAFLINLLVGWNETLLVRELESAGTLDPLAVDGP